MTETVQRYRYAIDFRVDGDIRFISHNDTMRMFSRACARAELDLAFTGGFNPRIRLSLPFPRPTGQASDAERLLLDLRAPTEPQDLIRRLDRQMPVGIKITSAVQMPSPKPCHPTWVRYAIEIDTPDRDALQGRAESLLQSGSVNVTRVRHKDSSSRTVDIRPFIEAIEVHQDLLLASVLITGSGSATPTDLCRALGLEADVINHLVRRVEIQWDVSQPSQKNQLP